MFGSISLFRLRFYEMENRFSVNFYRFFAGFSHGSLGAQLEEKREVLRFSVHSHNVLVCEWNGLSNASRFVLTPKSVRACERWPNTTIYSISATDFSARTLCVVCVVELTSTTSERSTGL